MSLGNDEFERLVPREKAERFEEILGFTWWLIVMQNVRRERETKWRARFGEDGGDNSENFPYVRIVNAHCPFWMHVIDEDVFQMIRGRRWIQSSGSKLTITPDPENRQISEWARQNIQQHARRGREAESYLCALFFYAATREGLSVETPLSLAFPRVLLTLGLDQYVELKAPRPEGLNISFDHIRKTCEGLFETFFVEMQRRCGHSSDSNLRLTFQLRHLLMELS